MNRRSLRRTGRDGTVSGLARPTGMGAGHTSDASAHTDGSVGVPGYKVEPVQGESKASGAGLSVVLISTGIGLLIVALADAAARHGSPQAELVFWVGLLFVFVPCAYRLLQSGVTTTERATVVALLGTALYLVKVLHDPIQFTFFDEFSNWRTAADISQSHHLFHSNTLENVNPLFPGLGAVTSALSLMSGLSIFKSGLVVVAAARLVLSLAVYKLTEHLTRSSWLAGVASLVYVANPNFLFFDSQFAYESLALPLGIFTLWLAALRSTLGKGSRGGLTVATLIGIAAVTLSHHLTSYALIAAFFGWTLVAATQRDNWRWPAFLTALTALGVALWTALVADPVIPYVVDPLQNAAQGFLRVITLQAPPKRLNSTNSGQSEPLWSQLMSYASVLLLLGGLLTGFWRSLRWRFTGPLGAVLLLAALAYPLSLALRLAQEGTETSNRASEFLFLGLGLVCAVALLVVMGKRRVGLATPFSVASLSVVFAGGVLIGFAPPSRLPGSFIPGADVRSLNPESVAAAKWAADHLDRHAALVTDRENRQLMGSYGFQKTVVYVPHAPDVSSLFFSKRLEAKHLTILRKGSIRYLVVDMRLSRPPAAPGVYFTTSEPGANAHKSPVPVGGLQKFDNLPGFSRIFSSGNIRIYEVNPLIECLDHCSIAELKSNPSSQTRLGTRARPTA